MGLQEVILDWLRIRGSIALLLAEINKNEDSSKNRELWLSSKAKLEDKKVTSEEALNLLNHTYYSLGKENYKQKTRALMSESDSSPIDEISYFIKLYIKINHPNFRIKRADIGNSNTTASRRDTSRSSRTSSRTSEKSYRTHPKEPKSRRHRSYDSRERETRNTDRTTTNSHSITKSGMEIWSIPQLPTTLLKTKSDASRNITQLHRNYIGQDRMN